MTVHVVTDSSSCLPQDVADKAGVTVLKLHAFEEDGEKTTAGLSSLELAAAYARLLERGGDDGVVAIHLSKELSATWSNAVSAAGVFDGLVTVVDTNNIGMVLGFAALRAAEVAQAGGSLQEVTERAQEAIAQSSLWLYVHRLDALRKGGRISAGQSLLTTALAIKPIFQLAEGKLILAAKTRTQAKAMDKLVDIVHSAVVAEAERAFAEKNSSHADAATRSSASNAATRLTGGAGSDAGEDTAAGTEANAVAKTGAEGAEANSSADKDASEDGSPSFVRPLKSPEECHSTTPRTVHIAVHHSDALEVAGELMSRMEAALEATRKEGKVIPAKAKNKADIPVTFSEFPEVEFTMVELSPELAVHAGPGAVGVALALG
ncbi:DegV family protein [Corynebacterium falsenii]|uniref:DegV family protein n=1 Tax=Corynebacterium falsenii TaxID=108486 RepID=UPI00234CBC89|nr:DegV family protein [Corynebacterium falsenii]MDC7103814.1 DegV family protein [Corynebacterium falsenii]